MVVTGEIKHGDLYMELKSRRLLVVQDISDDVFHGVERYYLNTLEDGEAAGTFTRAEAEDRFLYMRIGAIDEAEWRTALVRSRKK